MASGYVCEDLQKNVFRLSLRSKTVVLAGSWVRPFATGIDEQCSFLCILQYLYTRHATSVVQALLAYDRAGLTYFIQSSKGLMIEALRL